MISKDLYDRYINYAVIGLTSLISLFFLPFLGSQVGLEIVIPYTTAGWIVFVMTKLLIAVINVLIFHCFIEQAKLRVKDNVRYVEAMRILDLTRDKQRIYVSPEEFFRNEYSRKGLTIAITSALSAFGLAQAVLTWDALTFLTYLFTILMGLIFGVLEMAKVESYLTSDFWHYAKKIEKTIGGDKDVDKVAERNDLK